MIVMSKIQTYTYFWAKLIGGDM